MSMGQMSLGNKFSNLFPNITVERCQDKKRNIPKPVEYNSSETKAARHFNKNMKAQGGDPGEARQVIDS